MSTIKTGTTLTTAYQVEGDTTGALVIQTGATPTTAMTISSAQAVTFAGATSYSGLATFTKGSSNGITIGDVTTNSNSVLRMQGTSAGKNWQIANNLNVAGLEFTPSTATGGTTYTTPAVSILSTGNVVIGGNPAASAGVSIASNLNFCLAEGTAGTAYVNIFRQASSADSVLGNGVKYSPNANAFASSTPSAWARSAVNAGYGAIKFYVSPEATVAVGTDTTMTERARIDSSALTMAAIRLVFNGASGIPSPTNNGDGCVGTAASYGTCLIGKGSSYDIGFLNKNGNFAGYVATGATTITTSSDERLKENNQPITGALDIVCQMRHETGNYKSDPDRQVAFLIAQDVDALFPYAVEKTDPEQMGVNYNWIIPLHGAAITELTALVKELNAKVNAQAAEIAALKGQ